MWLVVEDLPWVDAPTRDLLAYLVRAAQPGRLLVLVTVRTHDPVTDPAVTEMVASLTRLDGVSRLNLNPLTGEQVAELVADLTAGTDPAGAEQIVRDAHGSPLLAEQLVAVLDDPGATVEDPMLARIRMLDPDTLRLVELASLGEGQLEHRLLTWAYDAPEPVFDAAVDRALQVGLLQYRPQDREFMFAHPLLRQAAEATLTPGDRLRGHRRWGEVLSASDAHRDDPRLLIAAAHHWAATDDGAETFVASLAAARETVRLGAATETADLLLRAWDLWDRVPNAAVVADRGRDDLLQDLSDALQSADRLVEILPVLDREVDRTRHGPAVDRLRLLSLRLFTDDARTVLGGSEDGALYDEALAIGEEILSAPASRLLLAALNTLGWRMRWYDTQLADRFFDRALAVAREACGPAEISFFAAQVARQRVGRGRFEEALDVCAAAQESCRAVVDYLNVEGTRGDVLAQAGQLRAALAELDKTLARIPDPELLRAEWVFTALHGILWRIAVGDWDEAASLQAQCVRMEVDEWAIGTWVLTSGSTLAGLRGDVDEADRLAAQARQGLGPDEDSTWDLVLYAVKQACARVAASRGQYEEALQLLDPVLRLPGKDSAAGTWPIVALAAEVAADRASTAPERDAESDESVALVASAVEALPRVGPYLGTWYLHARADVARARQADTAEEWEATCAGWRGIGHMTQLGWASLRLADALVRSNRREVAGAPLSEAWQIGDRLGAVPLRDAALAVSRRARVPIDPGGGVGAGVVTGGARAGGRLGRLTDRELEVLRQLAVGLSNSEIAEALFISPKTVSVHVSRILAKLEVTTRTAASTLALQEGLDVHPV